MSPFLADPGSLFLIAASLLAFAGVLAIDLLLTPPETPKARLRAAALGGRRNLGPAQINQSLGRRFAATLRRVLGSFDLIKTKQMGQVVQAMSQAGWRTRDAIAVYLFAKLTLPAGIGLLLAVLFFVAEIGTMPTMVKLLIVIGAVLFVSFLPDIVVRNAASKRRKAIELSLPDCFDLMVICVEAGSSLDAAVDRISDEMQASAPELSDEMRTTALELRYLSERRQALDNLALRVELPAIQALSTTLAQTERFGTPLAQALRVLASELRSQRMMRAEEKAGRLPALMTIPLVMFILPALFVVLMGPAILSMIRNFSAV
ncbi:MAG: type II secretion system F family protein [Alphaproteobacteria bacterium]|nr:type II secretion system F family protein [Alphaproteobacteria bacterium]